MKIKQKSISLVGIIIFLIGIIILIYFTFFYSPYKFEENRAIRIFWMNSYHSGTFYTDWNIAGFENYFKEKNIDVEIRKVDMNTFFNKTEKNKISKANEAMQIIRIWKPDLIYATDEEAQLYLAKNYINTNIPIVFSAVIQNMEYYGYDRAKNVAGVFEKRYYAETIEMLRKIYPEIKKMEVVGEDALIWRTFMDKMKQEGRRVEGIEIGEDWHLIKTFEELQKIILEYQNKTDAFIFLSFENVYYKNGTHIPRIQIERWIIENSNIPEINFENIPVREGLLLGQTTSSLEQGYKAGEIAYEILIKGKNPSNFKEDITTAGIKYINLARAKDLGLEQRDIPSDILINSKIYKTYPWAE